VVLLEERAQIANDTLESARDRYRAGLSDFLPVLTALQAEQAAQLDLLTARRQLVAQRIALHRALGGTWPSELETPPPTPMREGDVREGEAEAVDEAEER
jgi:outer membrane protein TolC